MSTLSPNIRAHGQQVNSLPNILSWLYYGDRSHNSKSCPDKRSLWHLSHHLSCLLPNHLFMSSDVTAHVIWHHYLCHLLMSWLNHQVTQSPLTCLVSHPFEVYIFSFHPRVEEKFGVHKFSEVPSLLNFAKSMYNSV